ncbi:hypothetical protein CY34DRAFT_414139 [Suillus luteus UH-Slu-Lm8-n1]|uniref:Uncharacterized protein n=1 Tax=Suillus luteus UH-Slu-Lm8-n1 TaxID=930992 RepID=A0A0D0AIZ5_9AGAM|nr:hypothetical protein CY34DRAFT_414139 [Suillus luteus UH-Slu-Lm8-n1]
MVGRFCTKRCSITIEGCDNGVTCQQSAINTTLFPLFNGGDIIVGVKSIHSDCVTVRLAQHLDER